MLLYFDLQNYLIILRQVWRAKHWRRRNRMLIKLLVGVPLVWLFHAICFFLDYIFCPSLWRKEPEKPVFIVGHGRSGTTLMHRLMAADEERFSYFLYWEMFFPSLLQKRFIRLLGKLDSALLGGYFMRKLEAWDERKFGYVRHIHNLGLWVPEEDDFVNTFAFTAGYWIVQAPFMEHLDVFNLDLKPPKTRKRWMGYYRECIKRQLALTGGNRIHLSKNPLFCGRVESLIEAFPEARFVVMVRDPVECIPSLIKLMETVWTRGGWSKEECQESLRLLRQQSFHCYRLPRIALDRHPETPHAIVDYRKLIEHPGDTVRTVYEKLGLEITEQFAATLEVEESKAKKHSTHHSYGAEQMGEVTPELLESELERFYEEFEWPRHSAAAQASDNS